ncbi:hypothetical protein [Mesorhizobium sp. B2-4-17]|uniref:hypothetical protein n=1 Tax=Mesorhizobium sp. B2-4-17 TaxID=2589932 RepID=UPI00112DFB95|nr:hypothetical protein [Mesorhizobium sp. B2-4-17]TPK89980.1 hypothetical protein FJ548_08520 [Mesorhizobium sp. B2-4-17]
MVKKTPARHRHIGRFRVARPIPATARPSDASSFTTGIALFADGGLDQPDVKGFEAMMLVRHFLPVRRACFFGAI